MMMPPTEVPPSFSSARPAQPWKIRLRGAALLVPFAAVAWFGASLHPRACGYGTAEELGVGPCSFLVRTGWPCPSCGLTTSIASLLHGQVGRAFGAHPFGPVLLALLALLAGVGAAEAAAGRDVLARLRPRVWWILAGLAGMVAGWLYLLYTGWASGRWPAQ